MPAEERPPTEAAPAEAAPRAAGLPVERTGLAWQRTVLSGLTCGLVVARLLAEVSAPLAVLVGVVAVGTAAALGLVALRRSRLDGQASAHGRRAGDGRLPALAAALLVLTALGGVGFVLLA